MFISEKEIHRGYCFEEIIITSADEFYLFEGYLGYLTYQGFQTCPDVYKYCGMKNTTDFTVYYSLYVPSLIHDEILEEGLKRNEQGENHVYF